MRTNIEIDDSYGQEIMDRAIADSELLAADSDAGRAHRAALATYLVENDGENLSLGIELDARYDASPVVADDDDEAPPWRNRSCASSTTTSSLVRPDLHIAWRGTHAEDPAAIIDVARGARAPNRPLASRVR